MAVKKQTYIVTAKRDETTIRQVAIRAIDARVSLQEYACRYPETTDLDTGLTDWSYAQRTFVGARALARVVDLGTVALHAIPKGYQAS